MLSNVDIPSTVIHRIERNKATVRYTVVHQQSLVLVARELESAWWTPTFPNSSLVRSVECDGVAVVGGASWIALPSKLDGG